jgi:D-glycero-alpha-D-manno-heptose 1-phosphate guanylyltransferase
MKNEDLLRSELSAVPSIILCGGKGTRLQQLTGDQVPKALVRVNDRTLLDHTLHLLASNGIRRTILAVSHHSEQIRNHLDCTGSTLEIDISETEKPLGIVPSVAAACSQFALSSTFLLAGADEICEGLDLAPAYHLHRATRSTVTIVLTAHIVSEYSSLKATLDSHGRITSLARGTPTSEYTATGIAFLEPSFVARGLEIAKPDSDPESLLNVLLPQLISEKRVHGMVCPMKRYLHISTPEAYQAACRSHCAQ